jgi:hypothetical protein
VLPVRNAAAKRLRLRSFDGMPRLPIRCGALRCGNANAQPRFPGNSARGHTLGGRSRRIDERTP